MATKIQVRRDSLGEWLKNDPLLMEGELVLVATNDGNSTDYDAVKIGDGVHKFSALKLMGIRPLNDLGNSTEYSISQKGFTDEVNNINELLNTAGEEIYRLEEKIDSNKKNGVLFFTPSINDGVIRDADILTFTPDTESSIIGNYIGAYWETLLKFAKGDTAHLIYAVTSNLDCSSGSCKPATSNGYTQLIIIESEFTKASETLTFGFCHMGVRREITITKSLGSYTFSERHLKKVKLHGGYHYKRLYCNDGVLDLTGLVNTAKEFEDVCAHSEIASDMRIWLVVANIDDSSQKKTLRLFNYCSNNDGYTYQEYRIGAKNFYIRGVTYTKNINGDLDIPTNAFPWVASGVHSIAYNNVGKKLELKDYFRWTISETTSLPFKIDENAAMTLEEPTL